MMISLAVYGQSGNFNWLDDAMADVREDEGLHPGWWTLILVLMVIAAIWLTYALFTGSLRKFVPVTLTSDRSGLVMESDAKVKLRGVQVGRVAAIEGGTEPVKLKLEIYPDQIEHIPANVEAQIRATTVFGAKFVDLVYPSDPSPQRLRAGQVLQSRNVSVEVNTVFENVVGVLDQIDPAKLNSVLSALAEGVRGKGEGSVRRPPTPIRFSSRSIHAARPFAPTGRRCGTSATPTAMRHKTFSRRWTRPAPPAKPSPSMPTHWMRCCWHNWALQQRHQPARAQSGQPDQGHQRAEPTTKLLYKYNPTYTCLLVGAKYLLDHGGYEAPGGNGRSIIFDAGLAVFLGDDPYSYPRHLPIIGAKGGPGGKPSCGSLPNVKENWPVRQLITNTGFGTGIDWRPNPGIGFPGYVNYLPTTRAVPEPPSIRNLFGGPAIGPIPYPGAPGLRSAAVRPRRHAVVAGTAACASAGSTARSGSETGL